MCGGEGSPRLVRICESAGPVDRTSPPYSGDLRSAVWLGRETGHGAGGRSGTALADAWPGERDATQGGLRGLDVGRGGLAFGVRMLLFLASGVVGMGCR